MALGRAKVFFAAFAMLGVGSGLVAYTSDTVPPDPAPVTIPVDPNGNGNSNGNDPAQSEASLTPLTRQQMALQTKGAIPFPDLDTSEFSASQLTILEILQTEYAAQPLGTKYSEGVEEDWCSDFVSWVYNEADLPFTNPNSYSWRIPGIYTLEQYFVEEGVYADPLEYVPHFGDVMLYNGSEAEGTVYEGHTNLVLGVFDGQLVTIGGNQEDLITVTSYAWDDPLLAIRSIGRPDQR
ncbi:MAG: CHAP domain-containing protein [Propionibacteriaceae bacterium]|jgi:hypothetical protein|nr:CHAP domain-containing protein [Propionibacteriaceae bacterium]